MDAVLAHEESENLIVKSTTQFCQGRLTAAPRLVEFAKSVCK